MLETNSETNVAVIEKMIEVLKANNAIGIHPDVVNHLEKALSIIEPYQFDMDGWIDRCLIPADAHAAYEMFKQTCGAFQLELNKARFLLVNDGWYSDSIKADIKRIEFFINRTLSRSYESACAAIDLIDDESEESWLLEYVRLTGKIYNIIGMKEIGLFSVRSIIYGKYVLFYEFLKQKLAAATPNPANIKTKEEQKPSVRQFALFFYYLQSAELNQQLNFQSNKKTEVLKVFASQHQVSFKNLETHYNKINNSKERALTSPKNISDLTAIIKLLNNYPEALKLATIDLKRAKEEI